MKLKDKVVIITGASSGIGKALAIELANGAALIWYWPPASMLLFVK
jgi:NAD(P)-dependent dehydrogenase (short-subunit alcohol dehydrogenase family)